MESLCFAVVPDGQDEPAAVFAELEDALNWGLRRLGNDAFSVRRLQLVALPRIPAGVGPGTGHC